MKVALICIHYPPLRSSCAIQMRDLAKEIQRQGHEPIVIVPAEDLSQSWVCESLDNVQVYRLSSYKTIDVGYVRRAINEMLLPFTMLYALRKSNFPLTRLDAVVWYSPSIFFGPLVRAIKKASRCPSYLILRDIFPEWALDLGVMKKGPVYYVFKLVAKYQYFVANIIGVQTPSNLGYMSAWAEKPNRKLEVLNNWLSVSANQESSISLAQTKLNGRKVFVYIGNMGIAQGMDILIDLAESLQDDDGIGFLFVGRGTEVERLKNNVVRKNMDNVLFYDEIDSTELPTLLSMCHVGLVALDPRHKSHNIPGKFLTYIQAGIPVLARINKGTDLAELIEKEAVGSVYTGDVLDEFKKIASMLINDKNERPLMSERGRKLSQRMFSSQSAVKQIVTALNDFSLPQT